MKILILNGPNLNMLGKREVDVYGLSSAEALEAQVKSYAQNLGIDVDFFQSNFEGEVITAIHQAPEQCAGLIINPGAWTHYNLAIRDALACIDIPKIEVHLSNIHNREPFRAESVTASVCTGQVSGLGIQSYMVALQYFHNQTV